MLLLLLACQTIDKADELPPPPGQTEDSETATDPGDSAETLDSTGPSDGTDTTDSETSETGPDTELTEEDEDEPYLYEEDEGTDEQLGVLVIENGISTAIATVFNINPNSFHEIYQELVGENDGYCPYYYEEYLTAYNQYYWRDSCTADSGVAYSGYGISYTYTPYWDGDYYYSAYDYYSGAARLTDSAERRLDASGYSSHYEYTYEPDGRSVFYNRIWGEFSWEGDNGATWLSDGLSMDLSVYAVRYPAYDPVGHYTTISGSLAGMDGEVTAVDLRDVLIYSESMSSACPIEPSGRISLRDSDGDWYDVEFQGPRYWGGESFPGDCDGCGDVYFRGELLDQVCPDFRQLMDWGTRPW